MASPTPSSPPTKAKPPTLRGNPIGYSDPFDQDYLKDDLLEEDKIDTSPFSFRTTDPLTLPPGSSYDPSPDRLVIAIDYGTTFTGKRYSFKVPELTNDLKGVAFATPRSGNASLEDIEVLYKWGSNMGNHNKIPSVISYSPASAAGEQQWGASLSPDAVTMVNTKLELDVQANKLDELELILQVLDGTRNMGFANVKESQGYPEYTWKGPEEIVTDYLTRVSKCFKQAVSYFGSHLKAKLPVDIVITVPVNWSYRAKNSTFRAVKNAGFNEETFPNLNDIVMVSEPEAAAIYTARYLKEDKGKEFLRASALTNYICQRRHLRFYRPGGLERCEATCRRVLRSVRRRRRDGRPHILQGHATRTDSRASRNVNCHKSESPTPLEGERGLIKQTGAKCGSAYIDVGFKGWLNKSIGDRHYRALDPKGASQQISAHTTEGGQMRQVMKAFDVHKKKFEFTNNAHELKLDLPEPLDKVNIPGRVLDGELKITHEEMKSFFDPCVNKVIELINGQIQQVERKKNRVRNVFLVGGFGESLFLQKELELSLKMRKITMRRPETAKSWTAVVQGAIIYGIEKDHHENVILTSTCSRSYGVALNEMNSVYKYDPRDRYIDSVTNNVVAHKQLTWLIRRGDLLLPDAKKETDKEFVFHFQETDDRKFSLPIYQYPYDGDDEPDRFETGQNELVEVAILNCDLSKIPIRDFDKSENPKSRQPYYTAHLSCKTLLSGSSLKVEIHWDEGRLCDTEINDVGSARPRV
ncbi:hypothetical protein GP486_005225 [Trichoglossum hirsutum]|uniref:Uncharacterized protein n=1 Tax=Trichoglossum hirsutum TaxID=265104 RepID=A0A9P8L9M4_9PEZI|nr:hypothetical protein GP486_005225 [Trichoglossum hirsutum]